MFRLEKRTRVWLVIGLIACAVFLASVNPQVGYARPLPLGTAPSLGAAVSYAAMGGAAVTNTGNSIIRGDLGLYPGLAVTGFPPGIVVPPGAIHAGDADALAAQNAATAAYNNLTGQACDFGPFGPTDLAGATLVPGVYCYSSTLQNSGTLTLNGLATDVWIFKVGSALTTGPGSVVTGTGSKCNIFWQVTSSATLDTTTTFKGTIIALQSISMNNGVALNGRAWARNGALTLINDVIDPTGCAGVPASGGVGASKVFSPVSIVLGAVSGMTISLSNANVGAATITSFTDNLPAGLIIAAPSGASTTCGGTLTAPAGGSTVTLTGGTIPTAVGLIPGVCTITLNVTGITVGNKTNTLPVGALVTNLGNSTSSTGAVLAVSPAPAAAPKEVPEADTLLLFGGGIGGLTTWLGWQWRKARARSKQ
jgi:hypothetical protein